MERKPGNLYRLGDVTREQFVSYLTDNPLDKFAKQFRSKADMSDLWLSTKGYWLKDELCGAVAYTFTRRQPSVANLQLLHVFSKFRRLGVGRELCRVCFKDAVRFDVPYFRVSSEPDAREFYESIGLRFLGEQKSGCFLSVCRINGPNFTTCDYSLDDPVVRSAVYSKRRGGCVKVYQGAK